MGAGRDLTVTNGGAGILLPAGKATVHAADDGRHRPGGGCTRDRAERHSGRRPRPTPTSTMHALIDITPQRIVDALRRWPCCRWCCLTWCVVDVTRKARPRRESE
ncbi:MAG: hypothetical protein R2838_25530 [Caldilineaceae bacterium]